MKSLQVKPNRAAVVTAIVAHVLAWAAFLWIAFWPYSYQGVSVNSDHPAYVDGLGYLSFGILYLPAALALITAAIISGFRPRPGKEPQQQSGA